MKKKLCLICLCGIILFSICGCDKNTNKSNEKEQININEKNEQYEIKNNDKKEETIQNNNSKDTTQEKPIINNDEKSEENTFTQNNDKQDITTNKENITNKEENKTINENITTNEDKENTENSSNENTTTKNESNANKEDNVINNEVIDKKEEISKKIVICDTRQSSDDYNAIIKLTSTFENDTIVYYTMYIEKAYKDGYKAEDDTAFKDVTNEKLNNLNDGRTGTIYITNNTIYYTLNFDFKNYPNLTSYIGEHTEYNNFLNHMTNNNGYSCITK